MLSSLRMYGLAVLMPLLLAAGLSLVLWTFLSHKATPNGGATTLLSVKPSEAAYTAHEGDSVAASFVVKNTTEQPIRILGTNTTCGCTTVGTTLPAELAPGESMTVMVHMKVGKGGSDGIFVQQANLLVNRSGTVPALVVKASVPSL